MFPKVINNLTLIGRVHVLEGIIFELKETLKYYSDKKTYTPEPFGYNWVAPIEHDNGQKAKKILDKYNKS